MKTKLIRMKHLLGLAGLLAFAPAAARAQSYIVNEHFYSTGDLTTGSDAIEILLLKDFTAAQLNGTSIGDSQTAKTNKLGIWTLTNMGSIASTFRRGTIICIGGATAIAADDTSYNPATGDWNILLKAATTSTTYLTKTGGTGDIAANDIVWVDDSTTALQIKVNTGWCTEQGTGSISTFNNVVQTPNQTGSYVSVLTVASGNAVQLTSNLAGAYVAANYSVTGAGTLGFPNGGANTLWIDSLRGSIVSADNASNAVYTGGNFNGVNGGSGWGGSWVVPADISGFKAAFTGDSTSNFTGGAVKPNWDINSIGNKAWGLYGFSNNTTDAVRPLTAAMLAGQEFRFSMDNGSVDNATLSAFVGVVGFTMQNASGETLGEFYFKGGDTNYTINDNGGAFNSGIPFTGEGLDVIWKPTGSTSYQVTVTRRTTTGTATVFNRTMLSPAGGTAPAKVRFFNYSAGNSGNYNFYFDNIGVDDPRPGVVSINRAASDPTNAGTVNYTVTFDESVSSLTASNFSLTTTGGQGTASVGTPSGSGQTWTVPVTTAGTSGTIRLDLSSQATAIDVNSNPLRSLPFNSGQVYTIDKAAPTGTLDIASAATYTTSATVNLGLAFSDTGGGALSQMQFSNDGIGYSTLEAYATSKSGWSLAAGDGPKTVYTRVTDTAGNTSLAVTDTIVLDGTAPTASTFSINSGATYATSTSATANVSAADATSGLAQVQVDSDNNGSFETTSAYAASSAFTLPGGDGAKTVVVRFTDNAGNISSTLSDSITLDTTVPVGTSVSINGGATYTNSLSSTLTVAATDATSGLADMRFSNDGSTYAGYTAYNTSAAWSLAAGADGVRTVSALFRDNAGLANSTAVSDTIIYDATLPTGTISVDGGAAYATTTSVNLTLSASDATSGVSQMQFSNDGSSYSALEAFGTSKAWTLATGDGAKTVYVRYTDNAGNISGITAISDAITLDSTAPTGSVTIDGGATFAGSTAVTLTLSATDATAGVAQMQFSNDGSSFSTLEAYGTTKSWTLTSGDGAKTVYVRYTDAAGNITGTTAISDGITLDTTAPTGTISINGGAAFATSTAATLTLSASDAGAGVSQMQFSNDGSSFSTLEPFSTTKSWSLAPGDGAKTVYVRYTDALGNITGTTAISDGITLDATAPTGTISINGGAAFTTSTAATLTLSASDAGAGVAQMQFSNDGSSFSTLEAYGTSKSWTLASGDGPKTVYVRYTDAAGNITGTTAISDGITLDATAPTGTISINGGASFTTSTAATLTLSASDAGAGVAQMQFSNDGSSFSTLEAYGTSKSWTLASGDGPKTVYVRYTDAAGNITGTTAISDAITLDTTAPTGTISINGGASFTTSTAATLTLSASDAGAGVAQMQFSNDGSSFSTLEPFSTTKSWSLAPGDGTKTVYVRYTDALGNITGTTAISDGITLDATAPTGTLSINGGAFTNSTAVTLTLSASDAGAGVSQMQFSNDGSSFSTLEAYSTSKSWILASGDGPKTVYVRYTDAVGNISGLTAISDSVTLDATAPTGTLVINGGAFTNSTAVTLTLSASDAGAGVSQMQFSNDGSSFSTLEAYGTSKSWTLATGDGLKTVYVRYTDAVGNISGLTAISDSVTLDTVAPTSSGSITAATLIGTSVSVNSVSSDGTVALFVSTPSNGTFVNTGLTPVSGTFTYTAAESGLFRFYTVSTDAAGNVEAAPGSADDTIVVNVAPNGTLPLTVTGAGSYTFPMEVGLDVTLDFSSVVGGPGTVTVSREEAPSFPTPPGDLNPAAILTERLVITQTGLSSFVTDLEWNFQNANLNGLTAGNIDTVYRYNGATRVATYPVTAVGNTLTVTGINGFSQFYAGDDSATSVGEWMLLND